MLCCLVVSPCCVVTATTVRHRNCCGFYGCFVALVGSIDLVVLDGVLRS
jgi:hypothetical protein